MPCALGACCERLRTDQCAIHLDASDGCGLRCTCLGGVPALNRAGSIGYRSCGEQGPPVAGRWRQRACWAWSKYVLCPSAVFSAGGRLDAALDRAAIGPSSAHAHTNHTNPISPLTLSCAPLWGLTGFIAEMRKVAMKLHTPSQAPKEGEQKEAPKKQEVSTRRCEPALARRHPPRHPVPSHCWR